MLRSSPTCSPFQRSRKKARDWKSVPAGEHFVQFYRTDDYLIECLAGYTAEGLRLGETVIVIATPEHRTALESRLRVKGVNIAGAMSERRYLPYDAQELIGQFSKNGQPNPGAFDASIGQLVRDAVTERRPVRGFGEMVALLWLDGKHQAAIEVEQLWNDLMRKVPLSLFCAYPAACTDSSGDGPTLEHVCEAHSCVISLTA